MSRLAEIPIRIEGPALPGGSVPSCDSERSGGLGNGVSAVLAELATLLEQLAESQVPAAIDMRSLPMSPLDRSELQRVLGDGEVQATVNSSGLSSIRETSFPGIWWVTHRDAQGETIAELLEVTRVPQMLSSASDEIAAAARALRERMSLEASPARGRDQ
ncbi:MAG: hydrogenase expression/formation C-terminal domain-containing protein [Steroidobacteraceae bacterium]